MRSQGKALDLRLVTSGKKRKLGLRRKDAGGKGCCGKAVVRLQQRVCS